MRENRRRLSRQILLFFLVGQQVFYSVPVWAMESAQIGTPLNLPVASALASGGSGSTNPSTGSARFSLPIMVPPGTGGFTPAVALAYDSDASRRSGVLGVGWSLTAGFPLSVERSIRDGAPAFDATDTFELGGARLVETPAGPGDPARYVTRNYDFRRIEHIETDGDYWRVLQPDGSRLYYGYEYGGPGANGSRLDSDLVVGEEESIVGTCTQQSCPTAHEQIVPAGVPFAWYLDRAEDRNGNTLKVAWESLGDAGTRYLTEIHYSGHVAGAADGVPDFGGPDDGLTPTRVVRFVYGAAKGGVLPVYRTGFRREVTKALSDIFVEVEGTLVRHYLFEYGTSPASGRDLLVRVRERGADDSAANEFVHTFGYTTNGDPGPSFWSAKDSRWALPDGLQFRNDRGRDTGVRILDLNGDGYPDVARGLKQWTIDHLYSYLGGPDGFSSSPSESFAPPSIFAILNHSGYLGRTHGLLPGDLDGDGRPDFFRLGTSSQFVGYSDADDCPDGTDSYELPWSPNVSSYLHTGDGWESAPSPPYLQFEAFAKPGSNVPEWFEPRACPLVLPATAVSTWGILHAKGFDGGTRVVDVNGDGLDDLIWKREVRNRSVNVPTYDPIYGRLNDMHWVGRMASAGAYLNSPAGFDSGVYNNHYESRFSQWEWPLVLKLSAEVEKKYQHPTWQVPSRRLYWESPDSEFGEDWGAPWSVMTVCRPSGGLSDDAIETEIQGFSGGSHIVDLNGDGLPELVEALRWGTCIGCYTQDEGEIFMNTGYGWRSVPGLRLRAPSVRLVLASVELEQEADGNFSCSVGTQGQVEDYGVRLVDVNGDGSADRVGSVAQRWKANSLRNTGGQHFHEGSSQVDPRWNPPVDFRTMAADQQHEVRLADVNADGLTDILVSDGAYLNLAEIPDKLETIETPYGATTTFEYEPHTEYGQDDLVEVHPTVDGQYRDTRIRIVVDSVTVDAGAGFGEPTVTERFAYFDPVYDVGDRSFAGFRRVESRVGGRLARTEFHTSDALRGRPAVASIEEYDAGAWDVLRRTSFEYAQASGADAAHVVFPDGSTDDLAIVDPTTQAQAFAPFATVTGGAAGIHLALPIATSIEEIESTGTPRVTRTEQTFGFYGNATQIRDLGDVADPDDDVSTSIEYVDVDGPVGGQQLLLTGLPQTITVSGQPGSLPEGTQTEATTTIVYDGSSHLGWAVRGNPVMTKQPWTSPENGPTQVITGQAFDAFGNPTILLAPAEVGSLPTSHTTIEYDAATRTFPERVEVAATADPSLSLVTNVSYEAPGCGAPKGFGFWCSTTTPNGATTTSRYDGFGRPIHRSASGGVELAFDHHDADRATAAQRTELRVRWDPGAPAAATDPDAIVREEFFDGLGRTQRATRVGRGTQVAHRSFDYDAAGNLASVTRWAFGGATGAASTFEYDVLGRLTRLVLPDGSSTSIFYRPSEVESQAHEAVEGLVRRRVERQDAFGRLVAVDEYEDPNSPPVTTRYAYDPFGSLVEIRDPVANDPGLCEGDSSCLGQRHVTRLFYDELGNRVRLEDPDSGTWLREYDARGLVAFEEDPRGIRQVYTQDALGRLLRRHAVNPESPEADDVYLYGLAGQAPARQVGQIVRIEDGAGFDEFDYDDAGNVVFHRRVVNGLRFDFQHVYDSAGRIVETTYPDGEVVTFAYDKRLPTGVSSASGEYVSDVTYDARDRMLSLELGGGTVTTTQFYGSTTAQLARIEARAGAALVAERDYAIDGLGRIRGIVESAYSPGNDELTASLPLSFDYDGLDRIVSTSGIPFEYDALGNLRRKNPLGSFAGWATMRYEDPQRPHALTSTSSPDGERTLHYSYDAAGNVLERSQAGGFGPATTSFSYDSLGRPKTISASGVATSTLVWGAGGDRVALVRGASSLLTPEPGFEYVPNLSRVNKHFFVGGRRVVSAASTWSAPAQSRAPGVFADLGRLAPPPPSVLGGLYAFLALALLGVATRGRFEGRTSRVLRTGAAGTAALVTPALLLSSCGPPVPTPGLGTHGQSILYYVTDPLGSTILTVDGSGSVRSRDAYLPFGDPTASQGMATRHRFAGGEIVEGSGAYLFGPRAYDPEAGRFLQPDPLVPDPGDPQSFSRYAYALNNPARLADPTGLAPCGDGGICFPPIFFPPPDPFLPGPGDRGPDYSQIFGRRRASPGPSPAEPDVEAPPPPAPAKRRLHPGLLPSISKHEYAESGARVGEAILGEPAAGTVEPPSALVVRLLRVTLSRIPRLLRARSIRLANAPVRVAPMVGDLTDIRTGEIVIRNLQTAQGTVLFSGTAKVQGRVLELANIQIFPYGAENLTVGTPAVMRVVRSLIAEARTAGFEGLRFTGVRIKDKGIPLRLFDRFVDLTN